jgi:FixJ family two-component response regulator
VLSICRAVGYEPGDMIPPGSLVFLVDDDLSVRRGLNRLLLSAGHSVEIFSSATDFLAREPHPGASCLILDIRMPGLNGLDLQQALVRQSRDEQIVFITGHADVPTSVHAMKAGAVDFLPKPFDNQELLRAVESALTRSAERRRQRVERNALRSKLDELTPREFEVLQFVIAGMLNKQIGAELGIAEKTIKVHRGHLMEKLGVRSVAELVRLAEKAGVNSAKPREL